MQNNANDPRELRVITDTMPVAAVRCTRDARFIWVNQTYAKWAARPGKDIIGLRIVDVMGQAGRTACAAFGLEFSEAAEREARGLYEREWPGLE